ncbi:hypothetical protein JTE90_006050 [Oedothorax gibbosus]|uniref:Uncharacterized protein n=1 Tax=Oedothorax gibbosus TaxID=931172 RepID=A0AAV6V5A8_9ARAC|nr:hypothetical protein JTE90_006050 [Oedothorax gibbosus]
MGSPKWFTPDDLKRLRPKMSRSHTRGLSVGTRSQELDPESCYSAGGICLVCVFRFRRVVVAIGCYDVILWGRRSFNLNTHKYPWRDQEDTGVAA